MPYDEAPSRRMALDADGTVGVYYDTETATEIDASQMSAINDESNPAALVTLSNTTNWVVFVMPELREFDGIFAGIFHNIGVVPTFTLIDTSANTTNGIDGTWTNRIADITDYLSVYDKFRDNITSQNVPTVKAIRCRYAQSTSEGSGVAAIHLYGVISPGQTPDRIIFLDTENADAKFTKILDFGDIPRGQTTTRTFKIKNNSSSKTINTIQVTAEDLFLNAGDWYTFGDDGVAYQATFAVGNLGPGATKLLYLKQIIPDAETLGVQAGRIKVSHASVT